MERPNLESKGQANHHMLGHELKPNTTHNQDNLNMSQLYRNGQSDIDDKRPSQLSEPSVIKQPSSLQNGQCLRPSQPKSRGQVLSGISFSRFEAISEQNQNHEYENPLKSTINNYSKHQPNKIPTSTKIISSNKLIDNPIQIKQFDQGIAQKCKKQGKQKHEYCFQFNYLKQTDLFEKFIKFSISKGMDFRIGDNQIIVIKKVAFIKAVLSLCFPTNSGFEHQVYQLTFVSEGHAKLTQVSGVDQNYYEFREQFLVQLWANKYLICGSLHQNLRHFLRFANSIKSQCKDSKGKKMGQIDCLKAQIETIIKKMSNRCQDQKIRQDPKKSKQKYEPTYKIDSPQLTCIKKKLKQMQQTLKSLLQNQLKKQQSLKKLRTGEYKKIDYDAEGVLIQKQISIQKQREKQKQKQKEEEEDMENAKIFVTPSMQRMLMNLFYLYLDLEQLVKKYIVRDQDIGDFQKKKMIIKGSLSPSDIFRYLELQDFSKSLESLPQDQQRQQLFPQSIKLLSSLRYSTYPSPYQTLEVLSILKASIVKQIESLNKVLGNCRVKVQDHTNLNRTLLQFCIYCLIMCDNRDIYPTIETALMFSYGSDSRMGVFMEESVKTAEVIKRGIMFIDKQWQL